MDRHAIFVDAGYFFAAGAQAAFNKNTSRRFVSIKSPETMLSELCRKTSDITCGLPLLRVYWYDAMPGPRLSLEQNCLAKLNGVKLRLGALNNAGEQKGVDSLIVTDLIDLARNHAIADAVLVSGDEDLRIAVQIAQSFGVRVHVLSAGDPAKNVSHTLQIEADSINRLEPEWFASHLILQEEPIKSPVPNGAVKTLTTATSAPAVASFESVAIGIANELLDQASADQVAELNEHFKTSTTVPTEFDRKLIARIAAGLAGKRLTGDETRQARGIFVTAVRVKATPGLK